MIYFEANVTTTSPMYPQPQIPHQDHQHQHQHQHQQHPPAPPHNSSLPPHDGTRTEAPLAGIGSNPALAKFAENDIQFLKQLLVTGEKNKWKQITKEINTHALMRRTGVTSVSDIPADSGSPTDESNSKNVSPTFVIKQYQSLLGLPNNALYFGTVGSSLPYIVAERGWDDILHEDDVE
ncbi:hypothetical protein CAAN3_19S00232 [[Candida] anglica]